MSWVRLQTFGLKASALGRAHDKVPSLAAQVGCLGARLCGDRAKTAVVKLQSSKSIMRRTFDEPGVPAELWA